MGVAKPLSSVLSFSARLGYVVKKCHLCASVLLAQANMHTRYSKRFLGGSKSFESRIKRKWILVGIKAVGNSSGVT